MRTSRRFRIVGVSVLFGLILGVAAYSSAQQNRQAFRPQGFIGGTVESANGREAGVWVIAETTDLPTKFIKIVVTAEDESKMVHFQIRPDPLAR